MIEFAVPETQCLRRRSRRLALVCFALLVSSFVVRPSHSRAADPADTGESEKTGGAGGTGPAVAVAAIRELGGVVSLISRKSDDWEVGFHLRGRQLTDAGLVRVAALKSVASLNLRDTKITGAGLKHLKDLTKLRWLHLERTRVGDKGTENLAHLVNLEYLNLYGTKITDKSLRHLEGLKKLRRLYVWKTDVTDAGVAKLQKALPKLRVVRGVDLSKFQALVLKESEPPKPTEDLTWMVTDDESEVPMSYSGLNTQVFFENKCDQAVNLYWKSYGRGELVLYATLAPGAIRQQNTYSKNSWVITDKKDRPLGYFVVGVEVSRAVIPKNAVTSKKAATAGKKKEK